MRITLDQYIKIMNLLHGKDLADMTSTEIYAEHPAIVDGVIDVCSDGKELSATQTVGLFEIIINTISIGEPTEYPPFLEVDGTTYHPVANLEGIDGKGEAYKVVYGMLNFGDTLEGLRLDELMKGNYKMIPYVLSHIYKENNPASTEERATAFLKLDAKDAYAAYFFLSSIVIGLQSGSLNQPHKTTETPNIKGLLQWLKNPKCVASGGLTRLELHLVTQLKTLKLKRSQHMKSLRSYFTKE